MSADGDTRPRSARSNATLLFRAIPHDFEVSTAHKRELREFARTLCENVKSGAAFNCLITNDRELQRLNKLFLGHDYATDVLSFPSGAMAGNIGEIAISLERAAEQALAFGHGMFDEVRILMLHGFLHLSGLDHETDRGEMASAERRWRMALGLPATLIARSRSTRSISR